MGSRTFKVVGKATPHSYKAQNFGKFASIYTPKNVKEWKAFVQTYLQSSDLVGKKIEGPIRLDMDFFFERPKSHFGTGKNLGVIKKSAPEFHIKKPDTENLLKPVKDVMTRLGFFKDDSQIVSEHIRKQWGVISMVEIEISWLDELQEGEKK